MSRCVFLNKLFFDMSVLRLSVGEVSFRHRSYVAGHGSGIRVVTMTMKKYHQTPLNAPNCPKKYNMTTRDYFNWNRGELPSPINHVPLVFSWARLLLKEKKRMRVTEEGCYLWKKKAFSTLI